MPLNQGRHALTATRQAGFQCPVSWYNGGVESYLGHSFRRVGKSPLVLGPRGQPQPPFAKGGEGGFRLSSLRAPFLITAAYCLLMLSLLSLVTQDPALAQTPYDQAEAQAIDRMLMCPVCPGETIDQSQVELARQMRLRVREMLAQGAGRQEVLAFFVERYGVEVLAAPPKSGFNLVAWLFPALAVPVALAAGLLALRAMRRRPAPVLEAAPSPDAGLDPFLARVDQELTGDHPADQPRTGGATHV